MKKTGLQILSEIRETLSLISGKMAEVELQLAELEGFMDFGGVGEELLPGDMAEAVPVFEPEADAPAFPAAEPSDPAPVLQVGEPETDDPVFEIEDAADSAPSPQTGEPVRPAPVPPAPEAVESKPAVIDVLADKCAWKTDIPGTPVRNIISGISLNDRILFINTLFKGDAQAFQATIALFNSYETLSQAEDFIRSNYPGWNLDSEVVYRFMMAVRRKLGR